MSNAEEETSDTAVTRLDLDAAQFRAAVGTERASHAGRGYDTAHDRAHGVPHLLRCSLDYASRGEAIKAGALIVAALHLSEELEREARGTRARADQAEQRIAKAPHAMWCAFHKWDTRPLPWRTGAPPRCNCWKSAAPTAEQGAVGD